MLALGLCFPLSALAEDFDAGSSAFGDSSEIVAAATVDEASRISVSGMTLNQAKEAWRGIRAESACYDWRCAYVVRTNSDEALYICPHTSIPAEEILEVQTEYNEAIETIIGDASPLSDAGKVSFYHDWLVSNVVFDDEFRPDGAEQWSTTPASAVLDGSAVCSGYARAFADMCRASGIECEVVVSTDGEHAWNKVRVDDTWYNIDATFGCSKRGLPYRFIAMSDLSYLRATGYVAKTGEQCKTDGFLMAGDNISTALSILPDTTWGARLARIGRLTPVLGG